MSDVKVARGGSAMRVREEISYSEERWPARWFGAVELVGGRNNPHPTNNPHKAVHKSTVQSLKAKPSV